MTDSPDDIARMRGEERERRDQKYTNCPYHGIQTAPCPECWGDNFDKDREDYDGS